MFLRKFQIVISVRDKSEKIRCFLQIFIKNDKIKWTVKSVERNIKTDVRNLLRQFKNIGNYLRLLFDRDVYGLCKLYSAMGYLLVSSSFSPQISFRFLPLLLLTRNKTKQKRNLIAVVQCHYFIYQSIQNEGEKKRRNPSKII